MTFGKRSPASDAVASAIAMSVCQVQLSSTYPVAIDQALALSQTMTEDHTIAAALQVTDILIILAKGAKKRYPWTKYM